MRKAIIIACCLLLSGTSLYAAGDLIVNGILNPGVELDVGSDLDMNGNSISNAAVMSEFYRNANMIGLMNDKLIRADKKYDVSVDKIPAGGSVSAMFDGAGASKAQWTTADLPVTITVDLKTIKHYWTGLVIHFPYQRWVSGIKIEKYYDTNGSNGWDGDCDNDQGDMQWATTFETAANASDTIISQDNYGNGICRFRVTLSGTPKFTDDIRIGEVAAWRYYGGQEGAFVGVTGDTMYGDLKIVDGDQGGKIELGGDNNVANPVTNGRPYIDFHYGTGTAQDYNARIINDADGRLSISGAALQVSGAVDDGTGGLVSARLGSAYNHWTYFGYGNSGRIRGSGEGYLYLSTNPNGTGDKNLYLDSAANVLIPNGTVGIGTANPSSEARLDVNGYIYAAGVKVSSGEVTAATLRGNLLEVNSLNVTGDIAAAGTITGGDITGNYLEVNSLNVTGDVTTSGGITTQGIHSSGHISSGDITSTGNITATGFIDSGDITANGNITQRSPDSYIYGIALERTDEDNKLHAWNIRHMDQSLNKNALEIYEYKEEGDIYESRITIKEGGNVGIGTSNPVSGLSVGGDGYPYKAIYGYNNASNEYGPLGTGVQGEGSYCGVIGKSTNWGVYGSGYIGVYGYGGTYDFYAKGSGINYGAPSSIRWKRNVKEIDNALGLIAGIRGVYFDWDEEHGGRHAVGFVGEEVGRYIPEIVARDENDDQYVTGMDYGKMTPVLLQAIKEQQKEIEELKAEIKALRKILAGK